MNTDGEIYRILKEKEGSKEAGKYEARLEGFLKAKADETELKRLQALERHIEDRD